MNYYRERLKQPIITEDFIYEPNKRLEDDMRETATQPSELKPFSLDDAKKFYEEKVKIVLEKNDQVFQNFAKEVEERLRGELARYSETAFQGHTQFPKAITVQTKEFRFTETYQQVVERLRKEKFPGWAKISIAYENQGRFSNEARLLVTFYSEITNG